MNRMTMREISIDNPPRTLAATLVTPQRPSGAAVLFVHGLGSDRLTYTERAQAVAGAHGHTCLALDMGGHGDSTGRLTELTPAGNLQDVTAAFDVLATQPGVDPSRVGICAASYGAYLSLLLTADRQVARLLMRAPALYEDGLFHMRLGARRMGSRDTAGQTLARLAAYAGPVLLVESERDEVISHAIIEAYRGSRSDVQHRVLAGATHALTDPSWRAEFQQIVVDFVADL